MSSLVSEIVEFELWNTATTSLFELLLCSASGFGELEAISVNSI